MYLLNGKQLFPNISFEHNDIQYPPNWITLATPEERTAIGIVEVPDPKPYDTNFYIGYDSNGVLISKDQKEVVDLWIYHTRLTCNGFLAFTDWQFAREADNGTPVDPALKSWRQNMRNSCNEKILFIGTLNNVPEIESYIKGTNYKQWPSNGMFETTQP
jgi:hypothetical protein